MSTHILVLNIIVDVINSRKTQKHGDDMKEIKSHLVTLMLLEETWKIIKSTSTSC